MALKAVVDSLDDVDEGLRGEYKEETRKDGKTIYFLDLEGIDDLPRVRGLATSNRENVQKRDKYKQELETLRSRLEGLPDDFTAEEYTRLKALEAEAEGEGDQKKRDERLASQRKLYEERIAAIEAKHAKEVEKLKRADTEKETFIRKQLVDDGLRKALLDAKVDPDFIDAVADHLGKSATVVVDEETGERKPIMKTDMGERPIPDY